MEKRSGNECGKIWEEVQNVNTAWRHGGWPPGANAVIMRLQVEGSCAEDGFCSVGLGSIGGIFVIFGKVDEGVVHVSQGGELP
ncbi:hypothetical protein DEO72_LG1g1331 [Vigna unguiculata]|uniref:Uncharacterized protein n=1 Tax=Vigna unguiculata TaxID=3917 RepID=A0A4D6KVI8_VIGUN|nr:hypothetical protein DEO72_LG1g1331 [Vigna unguiculata]